VRQPARVLITADAIGGIWTYALDLASGLAASGIEVTFAVLGPSPSASQMRDAQAIAGLTLIDTGLTLDWMASGPGEIRNAGVGIREIARRSRADLIHLNSPALAAGGGFSAPLLGACHSCLATWWSAVKDGPMPADFQWRTAALWQGLLECNALLAPSESFAADTARTYGTLTPLVVRNGRRRASLQPASRHRLVFTSGRLWDEGKNIAALDAAAGLMSAPLYAAGPLNGPAGGAPRELAHARALGALPAADIANWLARSPVYASAAIYEPFGLGVLEAAQAGCALVLSDIRTFRELWDGAAVFVDPRKPHLVAEILDALATSEAEARAWGRRAQDRSTCFTVDAMSQGVLAIYRDLRPDLSFPTQQEVAA
jgi:glycogen(starch) synthase